MTGKKARACCAIMVLVFGACMFMMCKSRDVFGLEFIDDDCLECHALGSTIVPENKQFALGAPWHGEHLTHAENDCAACHTSPATGLEPVPVGVGLDGNGCSTAGCHNIECEWEDFHEGNQTYLDNVVGITCYDCHPECAQPTTTTTTTPPPPTCGDGRIQWKRGETCDPPGSICGARGNPQWQCNDACQCVFVRGFCGDGKIQWKAGEQCEPFPGLDKCGPGRVCRDCRCVPDIGPQECEPQTCETLTCDCDEIMDCCCFEVAEGGGLCVASQSCRRLVACPNGTIDCPDGEACFVNTCCDGPVCVPLVCEVLPTAAVQSTGETMSGN